MLFVITEDGTICNLAHAVKIGILETSRTSRLVMWEAVVIDNCREYSCLTNGREDKSIAEKALALLIDRLEWQQHQATTDSPIGVSHILCDLRRIGEEKEGTARAAERRLRDGPGILPRPT